MSATLIGMARTCVLNLAMRQLRVARPRLPDIHARTYVLNLAMCQGRMNRSAGVVRRGQNLWAELNNVATARRQ